MRRYAFTLLFLVAAGAANTGLAQEQADPTGTWEWTVNFGGNTMQQVLTLALEEGELSGTISGRQGQVTEISDATYEDGKVEFRVVRSFNGNEFAINYSGMIDGDTLKGQTSGNFNGEVRTWDWEATRKVD